MTGFPWAGITSRNKGTLGQSTASSLSLVERAVLFTKASFS